jgi:hypothetical protein
MLIKKGAALDYCSDENKTVFDCALMQDSPDSPDFQKLLQKLKEKGAKTFAEIDAESDSESISESEELNSEQNQALVREIAEIHQNLGMRPMSNQAIVYGIEGGNILEATERFVRDVNYRLQFIGNADDYTDSE